MKKAKPTKKLSESFVPDEVFREIEERFIELFSQKYEGIIPEINYPFCRRLIKDRLKNHSPRGIIRIIELYFEKETPQVYHLPSILSAWVFNKYLPYIKVDPRLYKDADQDNKEIY
jgi:hypothetical protein